MSALRGLQRSFQDYVYRRGPGMVERVVGSDRIGARERLEIYADAYRLRLQEVLADHFPALAAMTGARKFERLTRDYIDSHPSAHFNVRWYGQRLAEFLRACAPWGAQPALSEMAALEWAMTLAFDAPDDPVTSVDAAAAVPPERWGGMRPSLHPAVQRVQLRCNVAEIRKAVDRNQTRPRARRLNEPEIWLVWRKNLTVYYRRAQADEAWALAALGRRATFAQLCEGVAARTKPDRAPRRAAVLLRRWIEDGLIRDLGRDRREPVSAQ